jgi:hypothetical protein
LEEGGTEGGEAASLEGSGPASLRGLELSPEECLEMLGLLNVEVGARLARHMVLSSLA